MADSYGVPCAICGGAFHEPITLAARRHGRDAACEKWHKPSAASGVR